MVDFVKLKEDKKGNNREEKTKFWTLKKVLLFFLIFVIISSIISQITYNMSPKLAVVPIKNIISTEESNSIFGGSTLSSRDIASTLYKLKDDESVKAVLLDINSPGGSGAGSEEIGLAVKSVSEIKPVYALINDVGASGAYWISASSDKIYASRMSAVGSIGVTSAGLGFEDFITQYNITYRRQTAGEYKDMGTPYREPSEEEQEMLQEILDEFHMNFIEHIATNRNMTIDELSPYVQGQIFSGKKALEIGLIDELGYYVDVIEDLKNITNNPNLLIVDYGPSPSLFDEIGFKTNGIISDAESQIMLK